SLRLVPGAPGRPARVPEGGHRLGVGAKRSGSLPERRPPHRGGAWPRALLPALRLLGKTGRAAVLVVLRARGLDGDGGDARGARRRARLGPLPATVRRRRRWAGWCCVNEASTRGGARERAGLRVRLPNLAPGFV